MSELRERLNSLEYSGEPSVHALIEKPSVGMHALAERVLVVKGLGFSGDHAQKDWWNGKRIAEREVTAVAWEVIQALEGQPEITGDNLVSQGLDLSKLLPGDRIQLGDVVLRRAAKNHRPCKTFAARLSDEARLAVSDLNLRGALFSVETGGSIAKGDPITLL